MKITKLLAGASAVICLMTAAPAVTASAETSSSTGIMRGDASGDGVINAVDASAILSTYSKLSSSDKAASEAELAACDVNRDGFINSVDASEVLSYYAYSSTTSNKPKPAAPEIAPEEQPSSEIADKLSEKWNSFVKWDEDAPVSPWNPWLPWSPWKPADIEEELSTWDEFDPWSTDLWNPDTDEVSWENTTTWFDPDNTENIVFPWGLSWNFWTTWITPETWADTDSEYSSWVNPWLPTGPWSDWYSESESETAEPQE